LFLSKSSTKMNILKVKIKFDEGTLSFWICGSLGIKTSFFFPMLKVEGPYSDVLRIFNHENCLTKS